jgi:hypothetical protein
MAHTFERVGRFRGRVSRSACADAPSTMATFRRAFAVGNGSLLLVLTSAIASCGGSDTVLQSSDGGDRDAPSASDGAGDGASDAAGDAVSFDSGDAAADASSEAAGDSGCEAGTMPGADGGCVPVTVRRPFLVGSSMRAASAVERADWARAGTQPAPALHAATADRLARTWLKDALEEHASIAAFARFTMHLLSVGAPPELVARSQQASLEEIQHARTCFTFAERYGGRAHGPSRLAVHDTLRNMTLAEIAALAAEEGCVGETLGVALATEQLAVAREPLVVEALGKIVRDETRHAELAWRFVAWAVARGGDEVRRAVALAVERAIRSTLAMEIQSYDDVDLDAWHAHGRLTCAESRAVAARAIREVVRPCLEALLGSSSRHSGLDCTRS